MFIWSIWHNQWRLMSGEFSLPWHPSPSNVYFASLTQDSWSNISFGTAFKLEGLGSGHLTSCMNFVGRNPTTIIVSTGSNPCSGKESRVNMDQKLKFGTYLEASHFGPFGLNGMTSCLTKLSGTCRKSSIKFGTNLSCMPRHNVRGDFWA